MAKRRVGIIVFLICFCLCLMPFSVHAASTTDAKEPISIDEDCSLTIIYTCENSAFSNLPVKLYKIADVSVDYQYTLTSSFEKSNLILNGVKSVAEWNVIRSTLETYILAQSVTADFNTTTDTEGKVSLNELNPGMYLAVADSVVKDSTYIFDSALIALPGLDSDGLWQYHTAINAKCKIVPPVDNDEEVELKVTKLWKGDSGKNNRPQSIKVEIFHNGTSYETVELSDYNHWTYTWKVKDDGTDWKVVERNIPIGYTMTVEEREKSFVLTNTFNRDATDAPDAPVTGDTSNIMFQVIIMMIFGSVLFALGISGKRNRV